MAAASDDDINLVLQDIVAASRVPPKSRPSSVKPAVANLASLAYERGLPPSALAQLVDVVAAPSLLDQASIGALIRNLYPAGAVPRDAVLRVVAALGHGALKPSLGVQAALLRWLVLVFHVLGGRAELGRAYPVLFNLLDTAAIRPRLAHLLALITRRKHVRPFRIQALLNLSRQTGNDASLVGLLRVFKDYYPEIIVGEAVRGKASAFKHPDAQWRARLDEIQAAHLQRTADRASAPHDGFRVHRPLNRTQRDGRVPAVHTSHATEDSVTLEEIEGAASFVRHLDRLELPNQLVAVLADPLLQKLLLLRPAAEAHRRVANWLGAVLRDVLHGDADEGALWEVLEVVRDFVVRTKTLPPVLLGFFARFFALWSGAGRRELVFDVLGHAPFHDFQELYTHIFQPLEAAIQDNTSDTLLALLALYTTLLHHWTTLLLSSAPLPPHASASINALVRHVSLLALTLLQTRPGVATESAILSFYEQSVRLVTHAQLAPFIRIELPPPPLVYNLLFSGSLATLSRLCAVLAAYKRGFEDAMATRAARHHGGGGSPRIDALEYDRAYVNTYNGFLMDACNCFWRARAFSDDSANARGCMLPRTTVAALTAYVPAVDKAFALASLFSLSHAPALCLQSIRRVRELEDAAMETDRSIRARHAGPVTQSSLSRLATAGGIRLSWQEYRIDVLETLSERGLPGVAELLKNTMTVLKNSMEGRSSTQGTRSHVASTQRMGPQGLSSQ
ncbi:Centromere protein I [Tolypocladium ophioglossoides CBS 100239]|uniref:Centromere protein I n=1 Tax=Tolypocladium ophioglossoides (strain CBS 100239) TaxID=1163406 RepID=A0A0L0NJQ6_TOLOC|nr:Centromere protein I [Tolypocladium ophioglossoides CBS 100239]